MKLRYLRELYPPPPRATLPLGVRVNDALYLGNLTGADPVSGAISADAGVQLDRALRLLGSVPALAIDIAGVTQRNWPSRTPDLRIIEADFPYSPLPRLEFIALLEE